MTISSTARRAGPFLGNDSATAFAFSFKVFSTSDITVTTADSAAVETTLVLDTDYTVTLNANQDTSPGGVVTYPISGSALPTGSRLSIVGNLPYDQPLDIPAGGNFNPVTIENEFDRIVMQVQQLREVADRSITASVTSSVSGELPVPQAGYLLGWDQSNTAIINYSIEELTGTAAYATWVYDTFTGNGIKRVYTLQKSPGNIANCDVSVDGQTLVPITDFTVSGSTLTFITAPRSGAEILVRYGSAAPQGTYAIETERKVATAGQTVVTLTEVTYVPGANNISVYLNGARMSAGIDFTETSSTSITFESALSLNDEIVCVVGGEISQAVGSQNVGFLANGTGAVSRSVQTVLRERVSVKDFGAVGDGVTDDTAAIQAAINSGAAIIHLPSGTYKITAALTVTNVAVTFVGDGIARTFILQTSATADAIFFNFSTYQVGGGVRDLSIHAGSLFNTNTGSTGNAIRLLKSNGGFSASRIDIQAFATGIRVASSYYAKFQDFQVLYAQNFGVVCDTPSGGASSAGIFFSKAKISNYGFTGTNTSSVGIGIKQSGGDFFDTIDVTTFNTAVQIKPTGTDVVSYLFMNQVLADTSITDGWDIDGTSGSYTTNVTAIELVECWAGYQTNGYGVRIRDKVDGVQWIGGRIRENGKSGVYIEGGKNISFTGAHIATNSKLTTNTYHGIEIGASPLSCQISNCRIGNFASGLAHEQADGINVNASFAGTLQIIGCDLSNPGTGKSGLANTSAVVPMLHGNLPIQNGYNPNISGQVQLNSAGTVAAGTTVYLGVAGQKAAESDTLYVCDVKGTVNKLHMQVVSAPGASQTYTYTVRKNASDTALTATISGSGSFETIAYGSIAVNVGDALSVKLVTSAGATVTSHRGYAVISG